MDLSRLSTSDLEALAAGNLKAVSTEGLELLAGGRAAPPPPPAEPKEIPTRAWREVPSDVAAQAIGGIGSLIQIPGQLYGLATGDFSKTGTLGLGTRIRERAEEMKSESLKAREAALAERIKQAEEERGQGAAFKEALVGTLTDPALFGGAVVENIPTMIPGIGAGVGVGRVAAQRALAKGAETAAARAAGTAAGVTTAKGVSAVQQGAEVGAESYRQLYDEFKNQGASDAEATARTLNAARAAGVSGSIISYLAQSLPGGSALERALIGGERRAMGRAGAAVAGALREAPSEALEEGGGRATQNVALREAKPEQPLMAGVGEAAGRAAAAAVGLGGGVGALQRGPAPAPAPAAPEAPPPPPASAGAAAPAAPPPPPPQGELFTEAEAPRGPTPEGLATNKAYYDSLDQQLKGLMKQQDALRAQTEQTTDPTALGRLRQQSAETAEQISKVSGEMARYAPTIPSVAQQPRIDAEARAEEAVRIGDLQGMRREFDTLQRENERLKAAFGRATTEEERTAIRQQADALATPLRTLQEGIQRLRRTVPTEAAERTPVAEGQGELRFDDRIRLEDLTGLGIPMEGGAPAMRGVRSWFRDNVVGKTPAEVRAMVSKDPSLLEGRGLRARALSDLVSQEPVPAAFQEPPREPRTVRPAPVRPTPEQPELDLGGAGPSVGVPVATGQPPAPTAPAPAQPAPPQPAGLGRAEPPVGTGARVEAPSVGALAPAVAPPTPAAPPPAPAPAAPPKPAKVEAPEEVTEPAPVDTQRAPPPSAPKLTPREERELQEDLEAAQRWTRIRRNIEELPEYQDLSKEGKRRVRQLDRTGDLTPESALRIAQDDEINRGSPLRALEIIKARAGVNIERTATLVGQKIYGSLEKMPSVTQKELFQNAFDAVKESLELGEIKQGKIQIRYDRANRTIQIIDNGPGMPVSVMGKEFLELSGTKKGTERSSGGFGVAKAQFLYGSDQLEVVSLRGGQLAKMTTTGQAVRVSTREGGEPLTIETTKDSFEVEEAVQTLFPDGHGTSVTVKIPETYIDIDTGTALPLDFSPYFLEADSALTRSPLFTDVEVTVKDSEYSYLTSTIPIGANLPANEYIPLTDVKFSWGTARVYVSDPIPKTSYIENNLFVLSNGLWQFSRKLAAGPGQELIRRAIYLDISPSALPEDAGYPFDLNRQRFSAQGEKDLEQIQRYLTVLYGQEQLADESTGFGLLQYINENGTTTAEEDIRPITPATTPTLPKINPKDKVVVKNGILYINGKETPKITADDIKNATIDVDALTIPQSDIDPNKVILHNNMQDPDTGKTLYAAAIEQFGEKRVNQYLYGIGETFKRLRDALVRASSDYSSLDEEGIGVSFDEEYVGVNIRVPFKGMFINPAFTKLRGNAPEIAISMLGTMQHEMAHFKERNHGGRFASEMQKIITLLDTSDTFDMFALKKYFVKHIKDNKDIFDFLAKEFTDGNFKPIGNRFKDSSYEQAGDEGARVAMEAVSRPRKGRPSVPSGAGTSAKRTRPVSVSAGVSGQTPTGGAATPTGGAATPTAVGVTTLYNGAFPAGGPSLQMGQAATDFITKFRTRVADKGATALESISKDFNGGVRNALKQPSLEPLYRQAEASDQLIPAYLRRGSIAKEKDTGLWRAVSKPGLEPPAKIIEIVSDWAKKNKKSFADAWTESGKIMESARQKEFQDLNKSMAKGREFPVSMPDAEIQKYYAIYSSDPTFNTTLRKLLDAARFDVIDNMVKVGRIPQEMADDWKTATAYIPFDRVEDVEDAFRSGRRFGRGIAQLGQANPQLVDAKTVDRQVKNALDNYFNWLGWGVRQVVQTDATIRTLRALEKERQARFLPGGPGQINSNNKDRVVKAYVKGNEVFFETASAYHAAAFNINIAPLPGLFNVLSKASQALRTAITAIPTFTATQIPQDIQRAIMYSGVQDKAALTARVLSNFTEFSKAAVLGNLPKVEHELGEYGVAGDFDFRIDGAADAFLKSVGAKPRAGGKLGEMVQRLSDIARASDFALRRAIYDQTLAEGGDKLLALHRAREIINFRRYGMGDQLGVLHMLTQVIPFYNAYIQGMDVLYRSLTGKDAASGLERKAALVDFYKTAAYVTAIATIYAFSKAGDEDYENMELRERDKTWVIGNGFGIPVPGELGILFKALPERVLEAMRKQGTPDEAVATEAVITWFKAAFDEYSGRGFTPSAIKPLLENLTNYSFLTQRPLEGTYQQQLLPSERSTSRTSELAKEIARFTADTTTIQVSPIKIDNILQGFFGTTAGLMLATTDALINPDKMDRPLHQMVGMSAFGYDPVGTRRASEFYEARDKIVQAQNTLNDLAKRDLGRAAKFAEDNAEKLSLYKAINSTLKEIEGTRAYRNWLNTKEAAESMTQKERADAMTEVKKYEQGLFEWIRDARNLVKI